VGIANSTALLTKFILLVGAVLVLCFLRGGDGRECFYEGGEWTPGFHSVHTLKKCGTVSENSMHSRSLVSPHWLCNALSVSIPWRSIKKSSVFKKKKMYYLCCILINSSWYHGKDRKKFHVWNNNLLKRELNFRYSYRGLTSPPKLRLKYSPPFMVWFIFVSSHDTSPKS